MDGSMEHLLHSISSPGKLETNFLHPQGLNHTDRWNTLEHVGTPINQFANPFHTGKYFPSICPISHV